MTSEQKLSRIAHALQNAGIDVLVMGGHAVRYYGVDRNTSDFDLVTSISTPDELRTRLHGQVVFESLKDLPAWRHQDFARFEIGTLPDGRQELLEFWIRNHLLADFQSLKSRAEVGVYGGDAVAFVSLDDLLKSKETERESDWHDIGLLEEIRDARLLATATEPAGVVNAISNVRSRRGFDRLLATGMLNELETVRTAISQTNHPVSFGYLSPLVPNVSSLHLSSPIEATALSALAKARFGTPTHLAVVEVIRRGYKRGAMEMDRLDKQKQLARQ